jgi:hypothetical protein
MARPFPFGVLEPFQFKQQVRNDRIGNKLIEFIERQTTEVLTPKNLSHGLHCGCSFMLFTHRLPTT